MSYISFPLYELSQRGSSDLLVDGVSPQSGQGFFTFFFSFSHAVSILLADSANSVKQALMEHSVTKLAVFFGKQKANDVILSHMITFLNDKEDSQVGKPRKLI